jgi:hypothetical protein
MLLFIIYFINNMENMMRLICKNINSLDFRHKMGSWCNEAVFGKTPVVVHKHKNPQFVVLSYVQFQDYLNAQFKDQEVSNEYFGDLNEKNSN